MRKVARPPEFNKRFEQLQKDPKKYARAMAFFKAVDDKGRYIHWDKLRYKVPPDGLLVEDLVGCH